MGSTSVKTTLNSGTVKEALQNIASVKALDFIKADFATFTTSNGAGSLRVQKTTPPVGFVFAYNSDAQSDNTFNNWFTPAKPEDAPNYPSLVGCLDFGQIGFVPAGSENSGANVLPEVGMSTCCMCFPVARPREVPPQEVQTSDQIQFLNVSGPLQEGEFFQYEGENYPVKKIGEHYMLIDQSKVLLTFLLLLNELLALKKINPDIKFSETYLQNLDRFHFVHKG